MSTNQMPRSEATVAVQLEQPAKRYQAIQWTGDNLADVQGFLFPASPLRLHPVYTTGTYSDYRENRLHVLVRDVASMRQYPNLGQQFRPTKVDSSEWILKDELGEFSVVTDEQVQEMVGAPKSVDDVDPTLKDA